ncbi:MAG: FKBP-type peptidyl-prolyl cis-trans isomerase [Sphingomonadales bacterium]|nr:FKBP-type peptidyl-prolyl cis-trans isomerase [Sphingomonadales bacterium]MDE2172285.1 FKBP-type peptidyl-prolyl cis-trans isomerase [Sphingomonadales bacterium]
MRALSPFAPLAIASLLMAPISAQAAAPVRKAAPARAVAARPAAPVAKASNEIIPLPLNPVIPAAQRVCSAKTAAGLGYTMLRPASGPMPAASDIVLVNYIGYLASTGAVFDQNTQSALPVNGVIPGFSQGMQMLAKGGIARFCIPAAMGYGAQESGPIPANSDLVFQVELIDYKTAAEVEAMRKAQSDAAAAPATAPAPAPKEGATSN